MNGIDLQYPIGGLIVLIGAIGFLKGFDFLAAQTVKRLLKMVKPTQQEST